jgi:hypothetical protein
MPCSRIAFHRLLAFKYGHNICDMISFWRHCPRNTRVILLTPKSHCTRVSQYSFPFGRRTTRVSWLRISVILSKKSLRLRRITPTQIMSCGCLNLTTACFDSQCSSGPTNPSNCRAYNPMNSFARNEGPHGTGGSGVVTKMYCSGVPGMAPVASQELDWLRTRQR